jgi:hypothetical protein
MAIAAVVAAVTAACGGSSSPDLTGAPLPEPDSGGPDSTANTAPDAGDGGAPYTLDDVCDRIAPLVCEIRKPCCAGGPGYDESACQQNARSDCAKDVAAVRAGTETFHPDRIPVCIPILERIYAATCAPTIEELISHLREIRDCQVFTGSGLDGTACARDSQCKPGDDATGFGFTGCDNDTHACKTTTILPEGAACQITANLKALCDDGLYCDASTTDAGVLAGTCKKKTPLLGHCSTLLECGLGNYCAKATGLCTAGKSGGASCTDGLECAALTCTAKADAGPKTCTAVNSLVKPEQCIAQ